MTIYFLILTGYASIYSISVYLELTGYERRHSFNNGNVASGYYRQQTYQYFSRFGPLILLPILGYYIDKTNHVSQMLILMTLAHAAAGTLNWKRLRKLELDEDLGTIAAWFVAFVLHAGSIHTIALGAFLVPDWRATILLSSPMLNGIATTIVIFSVEKKLSNEIDRKVARGRHFRNNQSGRVLAQYFLSAAFFTAYILL